MDGAVDAPDGAAGGAGCPGRAAAGTAGWDRRIDALAVEVLIALGGRDAAERRAGELLQTMSDRERLSLVSRSPGSATASRCAASDPVTRLRFSTQTTRSPQRRGMEVPRVGGRRSGSATLREGLFVVSAVEERWRAARREIRGASSGPGARKAVAPFQP